MDSDDRKPSKKTEPTFDCINPKTYQAPVGEDGKVIEEYKCEHCGKSFSRKSYLRKHQSRPTCKGYQAKKDEDGNIITKGHIYKCEPCGKKYTLRQSLREHQNSKNCSLYEPPKDEHGNASEEHKCKLCGKSFARRKYLRKHQNSTNCEGYQVPIDANGNAIEKYICEPCGKKYTTKDSLRFHRSNPTCKAYQAPKDKNGNAIDAPIYKCEPCRKSYHRKQNLIKHLRNTNCKVYQAPRDANGKAIEEYRCEPCGKQFTSSHVLWYHQSNRKCKAYQAPMDANGNAIAEPIYKCEPCGKEFIRKEYLIKHLRNPNCKGYQSPMDADGNIIHNDAKSDALHYQIGPSPDVNHGQTDTIENLIPEEPMSKSNFSFKSFSDKMDTRNTQIDVSSGHQNLKGCLDTLIELQELQTGIKKPNNPSHTVSNKEAFEPKPLHDCSPCGKSFSTKKVLRQHRNRPSCKQYRPQKDADGNVIPRQVNKYNCNKCPLTFKTIARLKKHQVKGGCLLVLKKLENRTLYLNWTTKEERDQLKCRICEREFAYRKNLCWHKRRNICGSKVQNKNSELTCFKCNKTFSQASSLKYHLTYVSCPVEKKKINRNINNPRRVFYCRHCDKYYKSKKGILIHKKHICPESSRDADGKIIPRVPTFSCEECDATYTAKTSLLRHNALEGCQRKLNQSNYKEKVGYVEETLDVMEPLLRNKCEMCDKYYSTAHVLKRHQKKSCFKFLAIKAAGKFTCLYCYQVFQNEEQLNNHLVLKCRQSNFNKPLKPFRCSMCNQTFYKKEILDYHNHHKICQQNEEAVEQEKRFQCRKCYQRFAAKIYLFVSICRK